jgi:hypothetical protein
MDFNRGTEIEFEGDELHQKLVASLQSFLFPDGTEIHRDGYSVSEEYQREFHKRFAVSLAKIVDVLAQQYAVGKVNNIVYPEEVLWDVLLQEIQRREQEAQENIFRQAMMGMEPPEE